MVRGSVCTHAHTQVWWRCYMYLYPQGLEVVVVRAADPFDYNSLAPCAVIPAFAWVAFVDERRAFYFSLLVERAANCGAPIHSSHSLVISPLRPLPTAGFLRYPYLLFTHTTLYCRSETVLRLTTVRRSTPSRWLPRSPITHIIGTRENICARVLLA
jgi:hypothetical protein